MATEPVENTESIVDVEEVYSKTERYIEDNRKSLTIIISAIVLIVGGYFGYKKFYVEPKNEEAQAQMFIAEQYFEKDSLDKALNGDGNFPGFLGIIDEFGVTQSANLAHYYAGICYLRKGQYEDAIEHLGDFESEDMMIAPIAVGATGDAYMEMGNVDEAISHYLKAAKMNTNDFTTPVYLMKAGMAYEGQSKFEDAAKIYEQIKNDFKETNEGREAEKYMARALALSGK